MANARKLPSGMYRVRAFVGKTPDGRNITKSFTAATKKEAEYLASQFLNENHINDKRDLTFGSCLDSYIDARENVLSPSTIKDYRNRAKNDYGLLRNKKIIDLTQTEVQFAVNDYAKTHAPKSTRNYASLITSVFKEFRPSYALHLAMPQKEQKEVDLPSDDDINSLIAYFKENDPDMYLAVLLAVFCPLRRSEISALSSSDLEGSILHIHSAMVLDANKNWIIKTTKTLAGDRFIELPSFVCDLIREKDGRVVPLCPDVISSRFIRARVRLGLPYFKFHALRHYSASFQHSIGIADEYIMARGGWNSDTVLKQVYRHALSEEQKKANTIINDKLSKVIRI